MLMSPRPNHDVLRAHGGDGNCAQMVAVVVVMVAAILADVRTGPLVIRPKVAPLKPVVPMSGNFLNDYGDRPDSEQFRSAPRTSRRAYCRLRMPWSAHWEVVAWST